MAAHRLPPSPPGHWILGHLPGFRRDMLGFFTRTAREYGDLVRLRFGPRIVHLASHPDFVEQVLVTENRKFGKSYVFELLRPVLGNGLLNSEGEFWLRQRRLIQPAFNKASVNNYAGIIIAQAQRIAAEWQRRLFEPSPSGEGVFAAKNPDTLTLSLSQRAREPVDLHREMSRLALGMVGKALMDIDLTDVTSEIAAPLESAMHDFSHRFESMWNPPQWVPTPRNRRAKRNVAKLDVVVHRIIRQRREAGDAATGSGDLLTQLIHARDEVDQSGMTDRQLRDEVMTLFLAGHETTANALGWTWFLLAQNPASERRLLAELNSVLGDRWPEVRDMASLPYTEAVIKESMRLYPPAYAFSRRVLADTEIGGYHVPARSAVIMSQWVVHRDPRWWDRADEFRPERWLEGSEFGVQGSEILAASPTTREPIGKRDLVKDRPAYAYFPFGGGPRICIGNTFAMLETILTVAALAPRFRFELVDPSKVRPWPSVTLRPRTGIPVVIHRREPAVIESANAAI